MTLGALKLLLKQIINGAKFYFLSRWAEIGLVPQTVWLWGERLIYSATEQGMFEKIWVVKVPM